MIKTSIVKRIVAIMFIAFLCAGCIGSNSIGRVIKAIGSGSDADTEITDSLWNKNRLVDFNGTMAKALKIKGYYSDMDMYVTKDNYIVSASDFTTTEYEFEQTVIFRDFLAANGVRVIYVNKPTKYVDDKLFEKEFGVKTYSNQNLDMLLDSLREVDLPVIDLRENMAKEGIDVNDLFYRTDHHWTTQAGLWATKIIAQGLNEYCGYNIDTSIYDEENYTVTKWENCWLGEQGRKLSKAYVGLDDYTCMVPNFDTNYSFKDYYGNLSEGSFKDFINYSIYNTENDVYENDSWHYSYCQRDCINNLVDSGKVLLIGDSYDFLTQPFLSLGVHEIDAIIMRHYEEDFKLREHILKNGYDTVIIAYAQFIVGAHDDVTNGNYNMFNFNQ